ncbi:hypothetical protein FE257_005273 [Aspergillus nanangensis]|uniref:Uncharacterized protein n=1 Tax=Aspergillus nanangensis TaxID=2582783 RepID=A0AAD4CQU7_ASPNN|nr:hypothetical protein FE257_005273 [Aspergillus nanangensis]
MGLTIAEVSGLIATGVFVLQLALPLLIPWILVALVTENNSILTWAVLGRYLHSSLWPTLLGSSTASTTGVPSRVVWTGWLQTAVLAVISIASICTPLGLYNSIEPGKALTSRQFGYARDPSAFGYGTPPRSAAPFTRNCGFDRPCPGSTLNEVCRKQGLLENCTVTYESRIPSSLLDLYRDGAASFNETVSSIFDLQYRTFVRGVDAYSVLGWYAKPYYRHLEVLILGEEVQVVEGLIVDMEGGGIGLRNHTVPQSALEYGASWSEDLLFIQPETECVPLNLTIDFEFPADGQTSLLTVDPAVVDHGGLSSLSIPGPSMIPSVNGQDGLDLRARAYQAAWLNNFLTLVYFNATNPDPSNVTRLDVARGQSFPIPHPNNFTVMYRNLKTTIDYGQYLSLSVNSNSSQKANSTRSQNPHGVAQENFTYASKLCAGSSASSPANATSTIIGCSFVYGAAYRRDGGSNLTTDPHSQWSIPLYSCATAVKATIKTVDFQYNGTGLDDLKVSSMGGKQYPHPSDQPLWGVEDLKDRTLSEVQPMWGVVASNDSVTSRLNVSTLQQESLYLPGYIDQMSLLNGFSPVPVSTGQNLPGVDFYSQALLRTLSIDIPAGQPYADYSGLTSLGLYAKWQNLSSSADGTASMLNLIWTDFAANSVVGTKGWGLSAAASQEAAPSEGGVEKRANGREDNATTTMVPVIVYERRIRYRLPFAIPAFVVLAISSVIVSGLIALVLFRRTGITRLREFLEYTSVGRVLGLLLSPGVQEAGWMGRIGERKVKMTRDSITVEDEGLLSGEIRLEQIPKG